jgi:hypothetical protein
VPPSRFYKQDLRTGVYRRVLLLFQLLLFAALVGLACWTRPGRWPLVRTIRGGFRWIARRKRLAVCLVGLLAFVGSAGLTAIQGIPAPMGHDEFSYLLAADTFAHGRLTNPTHPLWEHFETPHVIHQPTYASKYPPGQGMILAVGQVLFGHPIVGVWLSVALACGAICWMLQGWVPARWALLGGLLSVFQLVFFGRAHAIGDLAYWSQSYWGGAVAACGGALVFGAARRLVRQPRRSYALILGFGLLILANSRPFEGLVVCLPVAALLLGWLISRRGPPIRIALGQVILPLALALVVIADAVLEYNQRVTGDPLLMPYEVYEREYAIAPNFLWQTPRPEPAYRHAAMRDCNAGWAMDWYTQQQTLFGWAVMMVGKAKLFLNFYLGSVVMVLPWIALGWVLRNRWMLFALLTCAVLAAAFTRVTFFFPHYAAPITAVIFVLVVQGMRQVRLWRWRGQPLGRFVVGAVPAVCLGTLALSFWGMRDVNPHSDHLWRAQVEARLPEDGHKHLIILRDGEKSAYDCWIYNAADIDAAPVVWAREMDVEHNRRLLAYFQDRRVWLLDTDKESTRLTAYEPCQEPASYDHHCTK